MTKYKLVIPIKGIMILVFWEKSFKSMEADYSNHLASPLVASCGEISPSPWICCDKIKCPYQRCQFLAPIDRQPQGCDTTRLNPSTENLPHWNMQGHDIQYGSDESIGVAGWGSKDFSCHSQILFWHLLLEKTTQISGGREQEHQMQAIASECWCF